VPKAFAPRNLGRESWRHRARRPDAVVVLASGGLDSCALIGHYARAGGEVHPLFVRSGLIWEEAERAYLRRFLRALPAPMATRVRPLKVVRVAMRDLYGNHWSTTGRGVPGWRAADNSVYLPGRNVVLLALAAIHAALIGAPRVATGPLAGNPFPDASPEFFAAMRRAVSAGLDYPLRIEAPFLRRTKEQIIREAADLPLHLSFSCSRPRPSRGRALAPPCGACAKCRERILALRDAAVPARRRPPVRVHSHKELAR
jgi:7-cyano-7-deazaguanine synthase